MCRSRRELSNEYLLAKIGVDTAENEPLEVGRGGKFNSIFNRVLTGCSIQPRGAQLANEPRNERVKGDCVCSAGPESASLPVFNTPAAVVS